MNIVFLSPHFPPHYYRFCQNLKAAGANVLGIGDEPFESLTPDVRNALTEYYRIDDLHNYDGLVKACGHFTHRFGRIDRLDSLNEYWLSTEARLRDDFNISGIRGNEIDFIRRKSRMKAKFRAAGVPVARGQIVQTMDDAQALLRETGYPVVAKPDDGVGAIATYRLNSDNDLAAFFARKPDHEYIMEEFISGSIYSYDGLADRDANPLFHTVHTFSQGIMETVNEARHYHCCYASRKFNLRYVHSDADIRARYGSLMLQIESVPGVFSSALGDIGYIFRSPSLDQIMEIVRFIHQTET